MISTRAHGWIDWAAVAILGAGSLRRAFSPSVRNALGTASAYHASYSAVTDYEVGARPWLTMRQHLVLDTVGGAVLVGAGLLMRGQPRTERGLLMAAGLAELAIVACSEVSSPPREPACSTYPPLDTVKPVAHDLFVVDSVLPGLMGKALAVRMTVIRLPDGDLLLHSPVRFSIQLKNQLQALGRIAHLVAPNIAHWTFLQEWQQACPDATIWAAPGLRQRAQVKRSSVRLDYDLDEIAPAAWGDTIKLVMVPGGLRFNEAALFHRPSRTLVLTDLVVNLELGKLPALLRPIVRLFGMHAPAGMPPPYLRAVIKLRRPAAVRAAILLLDLNPQRVLFAHGRWFETDATQLLRRSLRWLLASDSNHRPSNPSG